VIFAVFGLSTSARAACNVFINGAPMPADMCALAIQAYGRVVPGHYWMDAATNWGPIGVPYPHGNLLKDAQRARGAQGRSNNTGRDSGSYWFSPRDWDWDPPNRR
jgi:hypothetical protein